MHEDEIRALVREAVGRYVAVGAGKDGFPGAEASAKAAPSRQSPQSPVSWKSHLSHGRFVFLAPAEPDAPCVVEPHVTCHHCGFCQSYGH